MTQYAPRLLPIGRLRTWEPYGQSAQQMRRGQGDELSRSDDLRVLPEGGEVAAIAGDEEVARAASAHSRKMLSSGSLAASMGRAGATTWA
jgi:hypothetical protein